MFRLENISKSFGDNHVLRGIDMTLPETGIVLLDGPSGAGKTTLLGIMAGIVKPDGGRLIGFDDIRCACAFQEDRLLPWFSVLANVALVCDERKASEMLEAVGLGGSINMRSGQLSGGMRKRVNLARALCAPAQLVLLDEPLQGLDRTLREEIILPLIVERSKTAPVVLVSHNIFDKEKEYYCRNIVNIDGVNGYSSDTTIEKR